MIFSLNVEGYTRNKLYLSETIRKYLPKIIFLQETWLPYFSESTLRSDYPDYHFQISCDDMFEHAEDRLRTHDHVWHGTAVAWHRDLQSSTKPLKVVHERFSAIKILCGTMSILAMSVYLPTSGKDDEYSECLSLLSTFIEENCDPGDSILIGADTNCSEKSSQRRIRLYRDFCKKQDLLRAGSSSPTFHHYNLTSESNIDTFLISSDLEDELGSIQVNCTMDEPLNFSCHDLLLTTLSIPVPHPEQSSKYSDTYTVHDRAKVLWDCSDISSYQEHAGNPIKTC